MLFLRKTPKAKWQIKAENIDKAVTGKCKNKKGARKEGENSDKAEFKVKIVQEDCRNRLQAGLPFGSAEG